MDRRNLFLATAALALGAALPGCASPVRTAAPAASPSSSPSPSGAGDAPAKNSVDALDRIARKLMGRLAPAPANVVFSPWSIAMVLSMVREGALGTTASELDALLGAPAPTFGDLLATQERALESAADRLRFGNALWGQRDLTWKAPFLARLASTYRAPLHPSDFLADPDAARREINGWVDTQTAGKIPELLTPGLVTSDTRLVLVNAVHFKAPWETPLVEVGTRPFTTADGRQVAVPTLADSEVRPWYDRGGRRGTALFCENRDFALVLVQSKASDAAVPLAVFRDVLLAEVAPVSVQLPAWKLRLRTMLTEVLQDLGVRTAFEGERADFSGMTDDQRLWLDFVVHEATIEVNAKGIEAAAATAAGMRAAGAPVDPKELVLDRPFHYALVHVPSSTCLFLGQVADPSQESVG
ncbi:MAG: serpin family protein [Actinobacteria bacterium]|nr:serpin family protein [Actinomycetota bacterium]